MISGDLNEQPRYVTVSADARTVTDLETTALEKSAVVREVLAFLSSVPPSERSRKAYAALVEVERAVRELARRAEKVLDVPPGFCVCEVRCEELKAAEADRDRLQAQLADEESDRMVAELDLVAAEGRAQTLRDALEQATAILNGIDYEEGSRVDQAVLILDAALATPATQGANWRNEPDHGPATPDTPPDAP